MKLPTTMSVLQFLPVVLAIVNEIEQAGKEPGFTENEAERIKDIVIQGITATDSLVDIPEELVLRVALSAIDLIQGIAEITALTDEQILTAADAIRDEAKARGLG